MNMIPKGHCHVEPVADSYFMASIKDAELVVIKSAKSKEEDHTIAIAVAVKKKQRGIKFSSDPHQEILILFYVYIHISLFFSARRKLL